ncbi:LysR substrate-binding domain-containing protein [Agarivorans litoreus]|uniref:LysR substrate-binding domain-containing protein n=1 Tax=Agarivorans litoreus TaxID=1510455 RepID=UPI001C7CA4D2|nr:LysR substrate-binding domain-containing protein [Agarivorans litoreus]
MRYSLKQLTVFEAVATHGSVSAAADKLALTQSAASMSLAQLEKLLGKPLFDRRGKRMVLSQWGLWLRPKAKQLLLDAMQIEEGFAEQQLVSGELQLCASQTAAEHLIPDLISNIDNNFPQLRISFSVENTAEVINGLINYDYQLGVIEGRCDDDRIAHQVWCNDHLVIVAAAHHPYAKLERVSIAQLEQARWVLREQGAGTRRVFDSAIQGTIDSLKVHREYEHVPVLRSMVANNNYLSCLPYLDVIKALELGELVRLNVPELNIERSLSFVWRNDTPENPLRDLVITEAKRMFKVHHRDM